MFICHVKGIPKVHKEGIALPMEAILYEQVRVACSMEQVGSSDSNGVWAPELELRTVGW